MKHVYNKDKARSIVLKRYPNGDASWTYVDPEKRL